MINELLFLSLAFFLNGCNSADADIGFETETKPVYKPDEKTLSFSVKNNDEKKDAEGIVSEDENIPNGIYCKIYIINPEEQTFPFGFWIDRDDYWSPININYLIDKDKTENELYQSSFVIKKIKAKQIRKVNIFFKSKLKKGKYIISLDDSDNLLSEKDDSLNNAGEVQIKSNNFAIFTVEDEEEESSGSRVSD